MRVKRISGWVIGLGLVLTTPGLAGRSVDFGAKNAAGEKVSQPETAMKPGSQVIHSSETLNRKMMDPKMARENGTQAAIAMTEAGGKEVKTLKTIEVPMVEAKVITKAGEEVVVARMSEAEFQTILKNYQERMKEPVETVKEGIEVGEDGVSLDDINKYSNPAERLQTQGIPVEKAGVDEEPQK